MTDIEIPFIKQRGRRYRAFEILPGAITWTILILPFIVSLISPHITVFFIIAYLLLWFIKAIALDIRAVQGYGTMKKHEKLPWPKMLAELQNRQADVSDPTVPKWHFDNINRAKESALPVMPDDIYHAIIVATWNETREILEPTVEAVIASDYNMKKVIFVLAYEDRGGPDVEKRAKQLVNDYKGHFKHAMACKHIDLPGEVVGKGGNITHSARELQKYLEQEGIDPMNVIVTTLDSDNRPHKHYLNALSYIYALCPEPQHLSFQPIPLFNNNIWDAPAPMRVIATGNTFWNVVLSMRPHMIRNFSSHAQGMSGLIDTDFWSVRTIVEDGHQFWRSYFRFDGNYEVYPIYLPIYQDAVLSSTMIKTLKMQFVQLRRWAWGVTDIAYVLEKGYFTPNKVPKLDLTMKFLRLLEGHVSWATAPLILAFSAFIPLLFNPQDYAANQLPHIASTIQTIALCGIVITLVLSFKMLPPKPARYKSHKNILMVFQWVLLPVTTIVYNALSSLYSQTRLMFGKYLGTFDVTDKAVVTKDNRKVM